MRVFACLICYLVCANLSAAETSSTKGLYLNQDKTIVTLDRGAIVRGPRVHKKIALEFTGGDFADGGTIILDNLKQRNAKASFFFIGDFYRNPKFKPLIQRIKQKGHYLGAHSDKHPLYASWDDPPKLLINQKQFDADLENNLRTMQDLHGIDRAQARYYIPPYEHYTQEIADWTAAWGMVLINLTRGTRSHTDYMQDGDPKFVPATDIVKSILDHERTDPDGLNGFLLLMHIGSGPERTRDHLYNHLGGLMNELISRGYEFVRVDELLQRPSSGH